ncbi:MFS transporter [Helicobacter valdiviensis]|uniref:MFS transporter n=1 Tax=Helicobacter valdiviensis TaxID=1458358 RepID=A0A2W6MSU2_9HELI|nr:MFS transporter [Helicobacter valdiviensis]PZT47625.1 MFS transporter [Helicobacter valdiviensis]
MNSTQALLWLNFFIADVRDGLGPYLGVFLKEHNFKEGQIGFIATIATLCALVFGMPLGILVDSTKKKKQFIFLSIILIIFALIINYFYPTFYITLFAQTLIALSATFLAPAFNALTLGLVGKFKFAYQISLNEAYKHAGTIFGSVLCLIFCSIYGVGASFIVTLFVALTSLLCLHFIKESAINHKIARGEPKNHRPLKFYEVLFHKQILLLCFAMFCFHLSNAYMLPLLSQRAHTLGIDTSGAYAALTIIIAQSTMVLVSYWCAKKLDEKHDFKIYFYLFAFCFVVLIFRGCIAGYFTHNLAMVIVQILDGMGAGINGVIVPIIVTRILQGSGHINFGISFVLILGGIGGALSSTLAGFVAQDFGYLYAYLLLSFVAILGLFFWWIGKNILLQKDKILSN